MELSEDVFQLSFSEVLKDVKKSMPKKDFKVKDKKEVL